MKCEYNINTFTSDSVSIITVNVKKQTFFQMWEEADKNIKNMIQKAYNNIMV